MDTFFSTKIGNKEIELSKAESHHCLVVKRKKVNDKVKIVDGNGNIYVSSIINANKNKVILNIDEKKKSLSPINNLHLLISPTKSQDRIDWMVEKATEIGVQEISFLLCDRTERKKINLDRITRISISALKQCGQSYLPKINDLKEFESIIKSIEANQKFIAHLEKDDKVHLSKVYKTGESSVIVIGPEGDFTKSEIDLAKLNNFIPVSLGENTLRTETAGVYVSTLVNILNE